MKVHESFLNEFMISPEANLILNSFIIICALKGIGQKIFLKLLYKKVLTVPVASVYL
jgi:hypothetical protein